MKSFAIIGGGASGVLLAIQLLEYSPDCRVTIFDPAPELGVGIAYGTENLDHLLNVRAAGKSAGADDPEHFVRWLSQQKRWRPEEGIGPHSFAPRRIYRDYLQSQITPWLADPSARLIHRRAEVLDLDPGPAGVLVHTEDGGTFLADVAILATGNGAGPGMAGQMDAAFRASPVEPDLPRDAAVVILGTGLSMVDSVVTLLGRGHLGPITAVSRRGLIPRPHSEGPSTQGAVIDLPDHHSLTAVFRCLQRHRRGATHDLHHIIDSLRPVTQAVWAGFSMTEKRRFLRHARPWWDVHRHRMAPSIYHRLDAACSSGQLRIVAARLVENSGKDRPEITLRYRGSSTVTAVRADHVIDCRGQGGAGGIADNPLLGRLIERGFARRAIGGLWIEIAPGYAVTGALGTQSKQIFAIGPLTIGSLWETVAIPDIREQVSALAKRLTCPEPVL